MCLQWKLNTWVVDILNIIIVRHNKIIFLIFSSHVSLSHLRSMVMVGLVFILHVTNSTSYWYCNVLRHHADTHSDLFCSLKFMNASDLVVEWICSIVNILSPRQIFMIAKVSKYYNHMQKATWRCFKRICVHVVFLQYLEMQIGQSS